MNKKNKLMIGLLCVVMILGVSLGTFHLYAQENSDESGISTFSLGDNGESIKVRGREETVGDYGDVIGYEITSSAGTGYVEYRDSIHHSMTVTTSEGVTEGYCMQPYVNGPSLNNYEDYNYVEGLGNSTIFSSLTDEEKERWKSVYVVTAKYCYGGYMADPNYINGSNEQDGGSFGTYIVERNGKQEAIKGIMIGGRVYSMSEDEARALTQTIVHYVGNRDSQYTITDFKGYEHPVDTSAAFWHLKAYADNAGYIFDSHKNIKDTALVFDNYEYEKPYQSISWQVYDCVNEKWVKYGGEKLGKNHYDQNNMVRIKVTYESKNMCNRLIVNSGTDNTAVVHNYAPFLVTSLGDEENYYDYFTINNSSLVPITVTYEKVESGKESIQHKLINNMSYDIDTFSQTAYVDIKVDDLINNGNTLKLSASTGVGSAVECYDADTGKYCARMFSSADIQDCLLLASNKDISLKADMDINLNITGKLKLRKISGRTDVTDNNPCYNMSGAIYNVYSVASDKDESKESLVGTFTTDEYGQGVVTYAVYNKSDAYLDGSNLVLAKLPLGWYMVCEESAPTNGSYILDEKKYYVNITLNNCDEEITVESVEEINTDPIPFEIVKQCAEGENVGASTLEGAEFTVWYYKGEYDSIEEIKASGVSYDRKWIFGTSIAATTNNATCIIHKELLLEGSSDPYLDADGDMFLPLGTIVVEETKAPKGYKLDGAEYSMVNTIDGTRTPLEGPYVSKVQAERGTVKLSVANKIIVDDEPIRADIRLIKKDKYTGEPMGGIPFSITSDSTGESHVIVTDENGVASTSSEFILHSSSTNGNDKYDPKTELSPTGIWFVGTLNEGSPIDGKGAMPYDTYTIKELPCVANSDYYEEEEFKVVVSEDGLVYDYGEIYNVHKPDIATDAFDAADMDKTILMGGKVSVIDKVTYENLDTEKTYILKGKIINKATGEPIKNDDIPVETSVEFTPETYNGEIEVPFSFNLTCCKGDKLVVYEYLYEKESGELVASHEDIECERQTLTIEPIDIKDETTTTTEELTTERIIPEEPTTETTEATTEEPTSEVKPAVEETPKTGDNAGVTAIALAMALSMTGAVVLLVLNRRKR